MKYMEPVSTQVIAKAEKHLSADHLRSFRALGSKGNNGITQYAGGVQASMKKIIYNVEIGIKNHRIDEEHTKCSCPIGGIDRAQCSHICTLLLHINRSISCTDNPSTWLKKGIVEFETQTIEEMVGSKSPAIDSDSNIKIEAIRNHLIHTLRNQVIPVPVAWILQPEVTETDEPMDERADLGKIILSVDFSISNEKKKDLESYSKFSEDEIEDIAQLTVGQFGNEFFRIYRRFRITASNIGYVIDAIRRKSYPPSLFGRLLNQSNLDKVLAIQWGRQNESVALECLKKSYSIMKDVNSAGFYLHTSGLLGASPDAISKEFTVEIKCPYSYRNDVLENVLQPHVLKAKKKKYVISCVRGTDGILKWIVNKDHPYYHQVQAQIYFSNRQFGYLFIWTTKSRRLIMMEKDRAWENNISLLINFYHTRLIPHILSLM